MIASVQFQVLWKRNWNFVARITVEDDAGRKAVKWLRYQGDFGVTECSLAAWTILSNSAFPPK